MEKVTASEIAKRNDVFRTGNVRVMLTSGVRSFDDVYGLIEAVRRFDAFTEDNDPYGEHDFGSLEWEGERVFWKIDYYDAHFEFGEDPLSPACRRVLTILLASEY